MGQAVAETWQAIAARKQEERSSRIPAEWLIPTDLLPSPEQDFVQDFPATSGFFTSEELSYTEATAADVIANIASGKWTSLDVVKATCKRAAVAQQLINCLTEILFEQALTRAAELDAHFQSTGKTVGPLHGLPISLKDQFNLEGVDSTIGYAAWAGKKPTEESTLVKALRDAGAVLYVKTNVPTTHRWFVWW